MEVSMKRSIASSITPLFVLLMVFSGTAYAQRSPSNDVRESNDPNRAAEVERKAESISGRSLEGSGESGKDASDNTEPSVKPAESRTLGEERSEGESGGTQESSEPQNEVRPLPESSGDSRSEAPYGGVGKEGETNKSSPAGKEDTYH
jgi:hypothetical protein